MQLTGVIPKANVNRLDWGLVEISKKGNIVYDKELIHQNEKIITLNPMEIKTFIIQ